MTTDLPRLLLIADDTRAGLVAQVEQYRAMAPAALAASLMRSMRVPAGRERLAIVAPIDRLGASLAFAAERLPTLERPRMASRAHGLTFTHDARPGSVAFLFPGHGSEYIGMLRSLRGRFPGVSAWFADLDRAAEEAGERPLTDLITPASDDGRPAPHHALSDMERGAPLGTTAALAMHEIVTALGIRADAHVGHSNGEHPAVIAAGRVVSDRAALCRWFVKVGRSVRRRAHDVPQRLIAVSAVRPEAFSALLDRERGRLFHSMDNCPHQQVIGGDADTADAAAQTIVRAGGLAVPLAFPVAYHTPWFAEWAAVLAQRYDELPLERGGRVPVYSCLHAAPLPDDPAECRAAMVAQWTTLVRFRLTVERLYDSGFRTFVEVGPDAKLTGFVEDTLRGRAHVAVSASSVERGEFVQLHHLVAELFVAGCEVDPSPLIARADDAAPVAHVPSLSPAAEIAQLAAMHARLIAEAHASLARGRAAWLAAHGRTRAAQDTHLFPLLGTAVSADTVSLSTRRVLTRRDDPFVDDHAFGRRPLVDGAYPLPVLPFTSSLELVAEAAQAFTGSQVREIHDARASRWLALDFGTLTLQTTARRQGDDVSVCIDDDNAGPRAPAFEATAVTRAAAPIQVPVDRDAKPPSRWDAESFYARYAFHGPGFRGLSRVTAVGPSGVEADITITANRGLPTSALVVDPAMLDCAGQLVAFWLLEQAGFDPTFGVFPYFARRVTIGCRPLPAGTRVHCRGQIARRDPITEGRFVFTTTDGTEVAALDGFMQRMMPLPRWLAALVFGGAELSDVVASIDASAARELLSGSWGIWGRAIAHLCLSPNDLDAWHRLPARDTARVDWLLAALEAPLDRGQIQR